MTRDPALAERLRRAVDAEREAAKRVQQKGGIRSARDVHDAACNVVDGLIEQASLMGTGPEDDR